MQEGWTGGYGLRLITQATSGDACLLVLVPGPVALQDRLGLDAWVMVACV